MKRYAKLGLLVGIIGITSIACEKEQPAENIAGNYSGVINGVYDGNDSVAANYPVFATATTKNKVKIEGTLFPAFEVLVSQNGVNVIPVSTDAEVYEFLYQGSLKELSFKYYKNGDTTEYIGTKP